MTRRQLVAAVSFLMGERSTKSRGFGRVYRKILVANDGSPEAFTAFEEACRVAAHCGAELHMVCIQELTAFPSTMDEVVTEEDEGKRRFDAVIERSKKLARFKGVNLQAQFLCGNPTSIIVQLLFTRRFDLLVVGFSRHSMLYRRFVGATMDRLINHAPCAVLVVK